jgi:hypothetical protein
VTTIRRRASAAQFAGVFAAPTAPRRELGDADAPDELTDPGLELAAEAAVPPPLLTSPPRPAPPDPPAARPARPRRPAAPAKPPPSTRAGLDQATRRTLDVETRRWAAARRKLDDRSRDLAEALRAAVAAGPLPGEIAAVMSTAARDLDLAELPPDIAALLA